MEFEWDPDKREANLAKHGIDFEDVITIWNRPVIDPIAERVVDGERREIALGLLGDDEFIVLVVYAWRNSARRVISARRAKRDERRHYQEEFGRGR